MSVPADAGGSRLRSLVGLYTGGALLLVGVMAAGFWLVGLATDPGGTPLADAVSEDAGEPGGEPTDPDPDRSVEGEEDEPPRVEQPEPDPVPLEEPTEEPAPEDEDAPQPDGEDDAPAPDGPGRIDPADVSVQVLDGYQQDGGAAVDEVAARLGELGYRVVATNPALRYEVTTVLWTDGFEAEGRQVAEDLGAAEVRQQPGNLSTQVAVHVVVGADRA